jgi:argininosuccinate lyase
MKLWGSRFEQDITAQTLDYTQTIDIDRHMIDSDLLGSLAHVLMLCRQGIVPAVDGRLIVRGLLKLLERAEQNALTLDVAREDVHLNIESMLIEELGLEVGGKLHTARSRNDQVVTDARLHVREQLLAIAAEVAGFADELLTQANAQRESVILGYTHSQAAQPVSYGFWLSGHASVLMRDLGRLLHAVETVNENPLGACAIAGTSFPIDRELTTRLLGFDRTLVHALDATSSRDFLEETAAALALVMAHLSRLAEEIVLWSSFEFRLVQVGDQFATGSSIMPQKKNPVVAEVARARAGTVLGCLVELLTVIKGVAMGYSSDLQQDKPPVWRALDTTHATVAILRAQMTTVQLNAARAEANCWESFSTATELANHLVSAQRRPFREAYQIVGDLVKRLSRQQKTLQDAECVRAILAERGIELAAAVLQEVVAPRKVLARQISAGSTGPTAVAATVKQLRDELSRLKERVSSKHEAMRNALERTRSIARRFAAGEELERLLADLS